MLPELDDGQKVYRCAEKIAIFRERIGTSNEINIPNEYERYFISYFGENWAMTIKKKSSLDQK